MAESLQVMPPDVYAHCILIGRERLGLLGVWETCEQVKLRVEP